MSFIYENPTEYSKLCKCDIEVANKRCQYYLHLHELMEKVTCPNCNAEHSKLIFDDDGGDYPIETFISCTECLDTFDFEDERMKDLVNFECDFDEILYIAISGIKNYGIENWNKFVNESTEKLFAFQ